MQMILVWDMLSTIWDNLDLLDFWSNGGWGTGSKSSNIILVDWVTKAKSDPSGIIEEIIKYMVVVNYTGDVP